MTEQNTTETTAAEAATITQGDYRYVTAPPHPHPLRLANIQTVRLAAELHRGTLREMPWDAESEELDAACVAVLTKLDTVQVYNLTVIEDRSGDVVRIDHKTFDPAAFDHAMIRDICGIVRIAQESLKELESDVQTAHARFRASVFAPVEGETGLGSVLRRSAMEDMRKDLTERRYDFESDPLEDENGGEQPTVVRVGSVRN